MVRCLVRTAALLAAPVALAQTPPQVMARVAPVLPDTAQVRGTVGLAVLVDTLGQPMRVRVAAPLRPDADSAAVRAVWQWRFAPARSEHGASQPAAMRISLAFEHAPPAPIPPPLPAWARAFSVAPDLVFLEDADPRREVFAPAWQSTGTPCSNVTAPVKQSGEMPSLGPEFRGSRDSLRVELALLIDADGRVAEAHVVSADDRRAGETIRRDVLRWRYAPATCDGVPRASAEKAPFTTYYYGISVRTRQRVF